MVRPHSLGASLMKTERVGWCTELDLTMRPSWSLAGRPSQAKSRESSMTELTSSATRVSSVPLQERRAHDAHREQGPTGWDSPRGDLQEAGLRLHCGSRGGRQARLRPRGRQALQEPILSGKRG